VEGERQTRLGISVEGLAAIGGLVLVAVAAIVDITVGSGISLLVIGPLITATLGRARDTAVVAVVAIVASIPLGFIDSKFETTGHWVGVAAVTIGGVLAIAGARLRERLRHQQLGLGEELDRERGERVRADLLNRASELLASPFEPGEMLATLANFAVPDMADMCFVDVVAPDGSLSCEAVGSLNAEWVAEVRTTRAQAPLDPDGVHPIAVAARTGFARLVPAMSAADLRSFASSDDHFELMTRRRYRSAVVVPLVSGGRTLAVISMLRVEGSPPYVHPDLRAAADLAHRVALALDNRRLFGDLRRAERRLDATLSNLAEAVTVIDSTGLIYANQAAADTLGYATPEELLAVPFPEPYRRFVAYDEDGRRFQADRMPVVRVLADRPAPPVVLRIIDRETGQEFWRLAKASPVRDEDGNILFAVSVTEDITEVKRAELSQRFLASASKLLSSSLDFEVVLDKVAWSVVPEVADWCIVHMPDERGVMRQVAFAHRDRARLALGEELAEHIPNERSTVMQSWRKGRAVLLSEVPDEGRVGGADTDRASDILRELGMQSVAAVPMRSGDEVIGVISFVTEPPRRIDHWQLELVEELGRRAGVAVENSRVHQARTYIATTLQNSLLPPRLPSVPGLEIAARFRAAGGQLTEVGGDFYDMFEAAEGWMIVVGDVTGKGPDAAATTSLARYTLRTAAAYEACPAQILSRLNEALAADEDRRQLVTAICAQIVADPAGGRARVRLACAGHPPAYVLRGDERAPRAAGRPGTLLGAFNGVTYHDEVIDLEPGDVLVLYTDGVTDTRGTYERFGQERLEHTLTGLHGSTAEAVAQSLDDAMLAFQDGPQRDDVALLVLRSLPAADSEADAGAGAAAAA
jgi:PAS domain S-box-containing protein